MPTYEREGEFYVTPYKGYAGSEDNHEGKWSRFACWNSSKDQRCPKGRDEIKQNNALLLGIGYITMPKHPGNQ